MLDLLLLLIVVLSLLWPFVLRAGVSGHGDLYTEHTSTCFASMIFYIIILTSITNRFTFFLYFLCCKYLSCGCSILHLLKYRQGHIPCQFIHMRILSFWFVISHRLNDQRIEVYHKEDIRWHCSRTFDSHSVVLLLHPV